MIYKRIGSTTISFGGRSSESELTRDVTVYSDGCNGLKEKHIFVFASEIVSACICPTQSKIAVCLCNGEIRIVSLRDYWADDLAINRKFMTKNRATAAHSVHASVLSPRSKYAFFSADGASVIEVSSKLKVKTWSATTGHLCWSLHDVALVGVERLQHAVSDGHHVACLTFSERIYIVGVASGRLIGLIEPNNLNRAIRIAIADSCIYVARQYRYTSCIEKRDIATLQVADLSVETPQIYHLEAKGDYLIVSFMNGDLEIYNTQGVSLMRTAPPQLYKNPKVCETRSVWLPAALQINQFRTKLVAVYDKKIFKFPIHPKVYKQIISLLATADSSFYKESDVIRYILGHVYSILIS